MSVKIIYNGIDAFYPYPAPLIELDVENIYYGELWGKRNGIVLNGQITGCNFDKVYSGFNFIKNNFSKNYQPLEVWEDDNGVSGKIFSAQIAEINTFSIENSRWFGVLPYSISIQSFPSGYFSGQYGILDPVETWSNQELNDYRGNINHTISCKGINTSNYLNNSLDNARSWVYGRSGISSYVAPALINNVNTGRLLLLAVDETVDRFNGTYSITENYTTDLTRTGYGVARYSTILESGNNIITVTLNGSVEGSQKNISLSRGAFNNLDKYGMALLSYKKAFSRNDINPIPLLYSVNEDPSEARVEFSYIFNNDNSPEVIFDYKVSINSGEIITASIDGTLVARGGDVKTKLNKNLAYSSGLNLYQLVTNHYNEFYPNYSQNPLNNLPVSSGIAINEFLGTVSLNANFSNSINPSGFHAFNYSVGITPSLNKFDSRGIINGTGLYSVVDLGYANRAVLTFNGDCVMGDGMSSGSGILAIKNKAMSAFYEWGTQNNAVLENNYISFGRYDKKVANFNFSWSFDTDARVVTAPNYDTVNTFRLK